MPAQSTQQPGDCLAQAPVPLRNLPGWLCWKFESREGKDRKVPFYAAGGRRVGQQGSAADRAQLTTFSEAQAAAKRRGFDGVGLAMMPEWGVTALDFDRCVAEDGSFPPEIEAIASRTYAEISPSGKGVRAFVRGSFGNNKSSRGNDASWGMETFTSSGFVTFTGNITDISDIIGTHDVIAEGGEAIEDLCARRFGRRAAPDRQSDDFMAGFEPPLNLTEDEARGYVECLDADMDRDQWVRVGMALHHQFGGDDAGLEIWDSWSSTSGKYPGEEALRGQWESFTRRAGPGRKQVTMASVIKMAREGGMAALDLRSKTPTVDEVRERAADIAAKSVGKFPILSAASMARQKPVGWLIKGVIPAADLGAIFGQSGSGKSFVSFDFAASIARGIPWRGHKTKQGPVVIITAEGGGSYGKRIAAYCQHHGIDAEDLPVYIINAQPNILEHDDISELTASIMSVGGVVLTIVDTLAQVTPGANENASEDMGRAIANAQLLRRATGSMIMLIHHAGKDLSRGARGWSGLKGALDVEIEVSRDADTDSREIRLSKMKDEEDGVRYGFKLETVVLGMDEDGDEYRSCVAIEAKIKEKSESNKAPCGVKTRDEWQRAAIEAGRLTKGRAMSLRELAERAANHMGAPTDDREGRIARLVRAIKTLGKDSESGLAVDGAYVTFYETG